MNKLNVFNQDWCPWRYPSNWIKNTGLFFRQFKWAYQRITKGYCDADYWDLDTHLSRLMAQSIKELADNTHGYPGTEEFPTYDSWRAYLYKIVYLLNYSLQEDMYNPYEKDWLETFKEHFNKKRTPEEEDIIKKYIDYEIENDKKKRDAQDKALSMIQHVYNHLWD